MGSLSREALAVAQDDRRHLVANCVVLHDVVCETDYELWIADEGWGCRPLSARASGAEDRTVRWLTGFVGHLALREEGSASRRLHRRDGRTTSTHSPRTEARARHAPALARSWQRHRRPLAGRGRVERRQVRIRLHRHLRTHSRFVPGRIAKLLAGGRRRAQDDVVRTARYDTTATLLDGRTKAASQLVRGEVVVVEAGRLIPCDGTVIDGVAVVDESAITGESAPVLREPTSDRSAVVAGARVVSSRIVIEVS